MIPLSCQQPRGLLLRSEVLLLCLLSCPACFEGHVAQQTVNYIVHSASWITNPPQWSQIIGDKSIIFLLLTSSGQRLPLAYLSVWKQFMKVRVEVK